jgi:predicted CopG family antitoxin
MVKTITIRDDVYRKLASMKRKDESFSELFQRLSEKQGSLAVLQRLRGSIEFKDAADKDEFLGMSTGKRDERRY